jgi:hypothetical protein
MLLSCYQSWLLPLLSQQSESSKIVLLRVRASLHLSHCQRTELYTSVCIPDRMRIKKLDTGIFSPVDHVGTFRAEVMLLQILLQCDPKQNKFFINKFFRDDKKHDCKSIGSTFSFIVQSIKHASLAF